MYISVCSICCNLNNILFYFFLNDDSENKKEGKYTAYWNAIEDDDSINTKCVQNILKAKA